MSGAKTDKPAVTRRTWKLFACIIVVFAAVIVSASLSPHADPWYAGLVMGAGDPVVWVFVAGSSWVIARLLDKLFGLLRQTREF
jgi:hypothetical protein